ncbi:uncharacterized protein LOC129292326 [Prosopis cineraria]|uniref:uncharacterized protein LOC129292326 n=1 Tax=Prosopis cineraria TaxID=364024 RepID=UPI0024105DF8|nr:uncharacterized protein LOC129292326 [Prosopis cineraria]
MEFKKIHACPNDCILYRREHKEEQKCPVCETPRYKENKAPAKVLWYLPIIPRFERLFANEKDAKNLRWHADDRISDGKLRHLADSEQWKKIDTLFPEFSSDPRNLKLGLSTDGMNPYSSLSSIHSSWPILLVIYNLSPMLCMQRKYIILSMFISGPKQPRNDIDVCLRPLVEDLKNLWEVGVGVFDVNRKEVFKLHAMIFCTINDFPAYGNLSGYNIKGHKACLICEAGTCYHQLHHGKKTVYLGHRRFLEKDHHYRKMGKAFYSGQEHRTAPKPLTGEQVYELVKDINVTFGKTMKNSKKSIWKKRSIFFDLPYWSYLDMRHCIDVMHVEKNVCDSIVGMFLDIPGKFKDGVKARLDLVDMKIKEDLHLRPVGKRTHCPPAEHTLCKDEKRSLLAIRGFWKDELRDVITMICFFFNAIYRKVHELEELDELENEAYLILCQLEKLFLPSFFDIMIHLIVHLVRDIKLCGPVHLRWIQYDVKDRRHGIFVKTVDPHELQQAHLHILNNVDQVQDYIDVHKELVRKQNSRIRITKQRLIREHNNTFAKWFKQKVEKEDCVSDIVKGLVQGPECDVICWTAFDINGYLFYTKSLDNRSNVQNSGVTLVASGMHFSSLKDQNPLFASMPYYRVIEEI